MGFTTSVRGGWWLPALGMAGVLGVAGCSAGSLGSSDNSDSGSGAGTTITFLTDNGDTTVASAKYLADAFHAANPSITVKLDSRPGGSDGDNLIKTRLSTGEMADVFEYNTGSLLSALKPAQNLVALGDQPWAGQLETNFANSGKVDNTLYAGPWSTAFGGGVMYNIPAYKKLGLSIPLTWSQFMANNAVIKKAGLTAVEETYGETWTAQLPVLADFHNVAAQVPNFAGQYTAGVAKYANTPSALTGFQHIADFRDEGLVNKDFASAKLNDGLAAVANGTAVQYPQIGSTATGIDTVAPGKANDVGIFAWPGQDASTNGLTLWPGTGMYIPKTTTDAKLDAAKKFIAYAATQDGCDAVAKGSPPAGPFLTSACTLPDDVSTVAKNTTAYVKSGQVSPALEFLSPIKGPNLEQICIQVGTGQVSAEKGASLYDADVRKQALQLGLPGWS